MSVSDELRDRVLALCKKGDKIPAIIELRRGTGWDLARAKAWLDEQLPRTRSTIVVAAVYAFGEYHSSLAECLDYTGTSWATHDEYAPPRDGTRVSIYVAEGFGESAAQLASEFRADLFDLNSHALSPTRADFERCVAMEFCHHTVERLDRMRERGFRFFLRVDTLGA